MEMNENTQSRYFTSWISNVGIETFGPFESRMKSERISKKSVFMLLLGRIKKHTKGKWTSGEEWKKSLAGRWAPLKCFAKRWTKHNVLENKIKNAGEGKWKHEERASAKKMMKKNFSFLLFDVSASNRVLWGIFQNYVLNWSSYSPFHVTQSLKHFRANEKLKALSVSIKVDWQWGNNNFQSISLLLLRPIDTHFLSLIKPEQFRRIFLEWIAFSVNCESMKKTENSLSHLSMLCRFSAWEKPFWMNHISVGAGGVEGGEDTLSLALKLSLENFLWKIPEMYLWEIENIWFIRLFYRDSRTLFFCQCYFLDHSLM